MAGPEVAEPVPTTAPAAPRTAPGPAPGARAPIAKALRGTDADARAEELWKFADAATDHKDRARLRRAALIVSFRGRDQMTEAEIDALVDTAIKLAEWEPVAYNAFGEQRFLEWTYVFPETWAARIEDALRIDADEAEARKDAIDAWKDVERVAARVPAYVLEKGLPITLDRARGITAYRITFADVRHNHITQDYVIAARRYMGRRVLAKQLMAWNGIAAATALEVEEGRRYVMVSDLTDFQARAGAIIAALPDRLRTTPWDDPALRVFERDVLALQDVALLQGFVTGIVGLIGLMEGWTPAADLFSDKLQEVHPLIRGGGKDNAWRALTWAYEWGYYGARGAEIWAAVKQHGLQIVLMAVGFVVVQFIPGLNLVVDIAVIIYSGIDALLALESMISAFKAAWDAAGLFTLERATARVADALVGDGIRLLGDLLAIAGGVGALKIRAAKLRAENAKLTQEQASRLALEEAAGKTGRKLSAAEEFLARHGNSNLARQAIRAAGGRADDAAAVLRLLQGTRPTPADLAVLQRISPGMGELGLASEAAFARGVSPVRLIELLRDPAVPGWTRAVVAQGMRRLIGAGLTEAELNALLAHFGRAEDLALAMRALDEMTAVPAGTRDVLRTAAQEGRTAADVVRAVRGAAPTALATAVERQAQFLRGWLGQVRYQTGDQARNITQITLQGGRRFRVSEYDLNHYLNGHTFENFAFTTPNINRAAQSTFWPPGTASETIITHARLALHTAAPEIEAALAAGQTGWFRVPRPVPIGGYRYQVGVDLTTGRITQFFPLSGPGVIPIPRAELHAIRTALQNAGRQI